MCKRIVCCVIIAVIVSLSGSPCYGGIIIRDYFDGEGLEVGDGTSINGGFTLTANSIAAASPATETDSYAEVVTSGGANGNAGITSNTSFDPLTADAMSKGLTVEWVVVSLSETTIANGFTFTLQPINTFFNTSGYVGVMFSGKAGTSPDGVRFVGSAAGSGTSHNLSNLYNYDRATFLDGFIVRFTINEAGWSFQVEGLDIEVAEEGTWPADFVLADVLDSDSFVSAHAQKSGNPITARYDSCEVWTGKKDASAANTPSPENQGDDVLRDVVLTWNAGEFAKTHDVYMGTSFEDVNDATGPTTPGLDVNLLDVGMLEFGKTYYWRVDEVNGAPDNTIFKGDIWSFTIEPYSIQIAGSEIVVTASSSSNEFSIPEKTLDGSGMGEDGSHAIQTENMWFTAMGDMDPWIQYEFDGIKKLDTMTVWNSNSSAEAFVGYGVKAVVIEYSKDGENWDVFEDVNEFSRASGLPTYNECDEIVLGGLAAKTVRLTIQSNWGGFMQAYSLSEVQFSAIPTYAREPQPEGGEGDVAPDAVLSWRAGREAVSHEIYLGTDSNELSLAKTVGENEASIDSLNYDTAYFWQIVEVNEAEDPASYPGDLWSFTTQAYFVVDDFDSYSNDSPDRPFQTWLDGFGYSADEFFSADYLGNGTGSGVGHDIWSVSSPQYNGQIMEGTIAKGGQSMPLYFNNTNGLSLSETKRTFAQAQDWTTNGIKSVSLNIYGQPDNSGQLYLKINGTRINYDGLSDALQRTSWIPWNIDLSAVAGNLENVTSLTLGIDGAGATGLVYIDDIRLYPKTPETIIPVVPSDSDPNLVTYYAFEGDAIDSQGNYPGTAVGDPVYTDGQVGQALLLDNVDDYIVNTFDAEVTWAAYTVSLWVKTDLFNQDIYSSLFNNNSSGADFQIEVNGSDVYGYRGAGAGQIGPVTSNWVHIAVTCDGSQTHLYYNGLFVRTVNEAQTQFGQIAIGTNRSMNNLFGGILDEVRVYNRALPYADVAGLAGLTDEVSVSF